MCKGTTNGEDIYIIPVESIPEINRAVYFSMIPNIIEKHGGIPVDKCIGKEIENLIRNGVVTRGCCCGHGEFAPSCLIDEKSVEGVKKLGYSVRYEINLKGEGK